MGNSLWLYRLTVSEVFDNFTTPTQSMIVLQMAVPIMSRLKCEAIKAGLLS